jgi:tetratricopeptide (TPR) repeat protein
MESRAKRSARIPKRTEGRPLCTKWKVGDLIRDRYEVYDIKPGGIGIVFIVYDHDDGVPYAIKTLQDRFLSDPLAVEKFVQEAEIWVRIGRHQNLVRAICVDQIDNQPCILLECITGSNLRETLCKRPLSPLPKRTVLRHAIQFCRGMIHAQERIPDFAHLDVKPENCMLTQDDVLKVTDFGLSNALFEPRPALQGDRSTGVVVAGTFPYMSPEHFLDLGEVGAKSDIYSFGVMLYEMLTGKRPFFAETISQWRDVHLKARPVEPRIMVATIPKELNDLTMGCLAKNPTDRPEGFPVIKDSLETILWEEFHEEIPSSTPQEMESWEYSSKGISLVSLGHAEEAIECFDNAVFKNPQNPHAWLNKGLAVGKLGNTSLELECYEKALAISPEYTQAWHNKGLVLHSLGRLKEAIDCYDRALIINPHQADVWLNKGSALGRLGRSKEELTCYEKALAIRPNHAKAWINKASALVSLGSFKEADECCDRALAASPCLAEAWVNKASALGALKRFNESIRCCEKALAINSNLCEAWVCKGLALGSLGRFDEEFSCYEKALAINPYHLEAWYRKGSTLNDLGRFKEAVYCYDRGLTIDSKHLDIWLKKGLALVRIGRLEEAVSCYEKALTIDPGDARTWFNKGLALRNLGLRPEADRCIQKAIALDPSVFQVTQ